MTDSTQQARAAVTPDAIEAAAEVIAMVDYPNYEPDLALARRALSAAAQHMRTQSVDAADAQDLLEGTVIRDARGMVFEKIGSEIWGSTRNDWGAMSDELFYPADVLFDPKGAK